MIAIISTCKEKLSELEFIAPLKKIAGECKVVNYREINETHVLKADKIIISGTALNDFDYLNYDFEWLKKFGKPVLGICAGMQSIAKIFGAELIDCKNIGVKKVRVLVENKLAEKDFEAYFLHTKTIQGGEFEVLATVDAELLSNSYIQRKSSANLTFATQNKHKTQKSSDGNPAIVKHKQKEIYGCIFHPEVLNEEIVRNFLK